MRAGERAYQEIRHRIIQGDLEMGQWLREEDLSESVGVSRTPVREALRRLSMEGLVTYEPNRGAQVCSWSVEELQEIFGLRALVEPYACGLAAAKADDNLIFDLRVLLERMEESRLAGYPDLAKHSDLNNRFHERILEASGNPHIRVAVRATIHIPLVLRTFKAYSREGLDRSQMHHRELLRAIEAGDSTWAQATMRTHVLAAKSELVANAGRSTTAY